MDLNFSIDFDAGEVYVVVDNHITLTVIQDDSSYVYKNFDKLDDESVQTKLKSVCRVLLTMEQD